MIYAQETHDAQEIQDIVFSMQQQVLNANPIKPMHHYKPYMALALSAKTVSTLHISVP